ncbi:hypothetical protein [Paraburkholderia hospita]|uniref:hypothetical protein n=1 Tax=Paraburkholderia hospita TaxID=169430 RepID=UPI001F3CEA63|nr:hypothetical protein [Paraburkholderia hospita]
MTTAACCRSLSDFVLSFGRNWETSTLVHGKPVGVRHAHRHCTIRLPLPPVAIEILTIS